MYIENMHPSERFDQKEIQGWEENPVADKTCANTKAQFVPIYKSHERFSSKRSTQAGVEDEPVNLLRNKILCMPNFLSGSCSS